MKGVLHVTAPGDIQLADNVKSGGPQHLVLLVPQCLGGSHNDTVAGVHAYRVDIFHITYGDTVALAVPHHLILDLFPSGDTPLYQHLSHTGKPEAVLQDLHKLMPVVGDTAAASSQGIGRTQHHRIADLLGELHAVFHRLYYKRSCHRLSDLLHGGLELQTVLRLLDGLSRGSDQPHVVSL